MQENLKSIEFLGTTRFEYQLDLGILIKAPFGRFNQRSPNLVSSLSLSSGITIARNQDIVDTQQLSSSNLQQTFQQQGYVFVKNFFSLVEMEALIAQIESPQSEQCLDQCLSKGTLRFYANLYRHNDAIQKFVAQPRLVNFLQPFVGSDIWVRWDQAVAKGPGAKTFPWHQDNAYNGFKFTHYQLWVALTSMTIENGGLWLVPGSHHQLLPHRRVDDHMVYKGEPEDPHLYHG